MAAAKGGSRKRHARETRNGNSYERNKAKEMWPTHWSSPPASYFLWYRRIKLNSEPLEKVQPLNDTAPLMELQASLPYPRILCHMNPVHALAPKFLTIHFNIILLGVAPARGLFPSRLLITHWCTWCGQHAPPRHPSGLGNSEICYEVPHCVIISSSLLFHPNIFLSSLSSNTISKRLQTRQSGVS